jgi:glycosyltransferase involved in cell wall biosynthesis
MNRQRITVAMTGARLNYAVPRALHHSDQLNALITDFYLNNRLTRGVLRTLSAVPGAPKQLNAILGRYHPDLAGARVLSRSLRGANTIWRRRQAEKAQDRSSRAGAELCGASQLAEIMEKNLDIPGDALYAFEGAALEAFKVAEARGAARVLEQSIAASPYSARLLQSEIAKWGQWYEQVDLPQWNLKKADRLEKEWALADRIVAPSEFVRSSLLACGVPGEKIRVFPYGVTLPKASCRRSDYDGTRPLRVLFGGNVLLRKGIHYLLAAAKTLGPSAVELRVVGAMRLRSDIANQFEAQVDFRGRVPRSEMPDHFRWADVLVLPSLIEGSATVVYEALSYGLPAVVTPNAGSVVEHGVDGLIVAAFSSEAIVQALTGYMDSPERLQAHSAAARQGRQKVSYNRYEADLANFFRTFADERSDIVDFRMPPGHTTKPGP